MGSINNNSGKPRPTLVMKDLKNAFNELVKVREKGVEKYPRMNWAESIGTEDADNFIEENFDSMLRHAMELLAGNTVDEETGCHHAAHIMLRAAFIVEYDQSHLATKGE